MESNPGHVCLEWPMHFDLSYVVDKLADTFQDYNLAKSLGLPFETDKEKKTNCFKL